MSRSPRLLPGGTGALDWLGVGASLACAVHCAVVPILILALPALGVSWLLSDRVARLMIAVSGTIAVLSLPRGLRLHAHPGPPLLAGLGIALLIGGELLQGDSVRGLVLGLAGGLLVMGGHLLNRSLCLACPACSFGNAAGAGPCQGEAP